MSFLEQLSRSISGMTAPASATPPTGGVPANSDMTNMHFQLAGGNVPSQSGQQGNQNAAPGQNTTPGQNNQNGTQPSGSRSQPAQFNPVDIFAPTKDNTNTDTPPGFVLDEKSLQTLANGQDFFKGVDPELLTKANSGDFAAQQTVMQAAMRNLYQTLITHQGKLTETFVNQREQFGSKQLPGVVRRELAVGSLANTPNFANPGVRAHLVSLAKQFEQQFPDAPPDQIAQLAKQAVLDMAAAISPQNANTQSGRGQPQANQSVDWDSWFDK